MKNNKSEQTKERIIKIILIIVIIILLIHNCCILKKLNNKKVPSGNVEIIEINCDKDDTCEVEDNDSGKKDDNGSNNGSKDLDKDNKNGKNNNLPINDDTDEPTDDGELGLIVEDKDITWSGNTIAKIFTNSMYEFKNKIAPESSNTYQFIVKNATEYNLKYNISFIENNPYSINMKYKLKRNDTYVIDHYVSPSEINVSNILLDSGKNDTYYLEWKWVSSDNDTEIGTNPNAEYELKIDIKAESVNG